MSNKDQTDNQIFSSTLESYAYTHIRRHVLPKILDSIIEKQQIDISLQSSMTSYFSLWCVCLQRELQKHYDSTAPLIIVTPNDEQGKHILSNVHMYNNILDNSQSLDDTVQAKEDTTGLYNNSQHVHKNIHLQSWGAALGTGIAQYASIRAERAASLHALSHDTPNILICSINQWNQLLPSPKILKEQSLVLSCKSSFDPIQVSEILTQWNYTRVPKVSNAGEFSLRGEVLDIFMGRNTNATSVNAPVRIIFDFESIESIKYFDVYTQLTTSEISHILLHPRSEFVWNTNTLEILEQNIHTLFPEITSAVLKKAVTHIQNFGYDELDYMYGVWGNKQPVHILEYFDPSPVVLFTNYETLAKHNEYYWNTQQELFLSLGSIQCIPRYNRIQDMIRSRTSSVSPIPVYRTKNVTNAINLGDSDPQSFAGNISYFIKYLSQNRDTDHVFILTENHIHRDRVVVLLYGALSSRSEEAADFKNDTIGYQRVLQESLGLTFVIANMPTGFTCNIPQEEGIDFVKNIKILSQLDILGKQLYHFDNEEYHPIEYWNQIEPGDVVVHIQHGIGKFVELTRITIAGVEKDFIQLVYANSEKLYVPIEQMNMVQRYVGQSYENITLDSIGGKGWEHRKAKVLKKIEDMSQELLEIQAKRNTVSGYSFASGAEWEQEFIDAFPFEETADQLRAWEEISLDMKRARPMDRLVVGDVGFGKTELAFRAAFRAISAGKQVSFLVPTTILTEQHYYSALDRFKQFPVQIAMLSRFLSTREQKQVIAQLKDGTVDLVIGTHRLIQKDIIYKDLGLCIIDEEHRFGVKDKEHIKKYRETIDYLALSATPIPRTLYQSIMQLREMSVLHTPPKERKPIRTFVEKFDEKLVSKAIIMEINRGGQVFYLHNRIASLQEVQRFIEQLVPQATVLTASGQMNPKDLEDTMYRFIHKGANVLVSTTIIENGIDIPNVNTIIIDRADNYGIAQLYQLRGRVGRSNQVSYAYLFYPDEYHISELALKRLSAISDNSELGAGFQLAMRDMEARGTGNLLGKEQSGSIFSVGYDYYIKLLDETMKKAKGQDIGVQEPVLELSYTGFVPNSYIPDTSTKMELYKQISSVRNLEEYDTLIYTIQDRYGPMPQEITHLCWIAKLKILCTSLYIHLLKDTPHALELHFSNMSKIPINIITDLIQKGDVQLSKKAANVLLLEYEHTNNVTTLETKYHMLNHFFSKVV